MSRGISFLTVVVNWADAIAVRSTIEITFILLGSVLMRLLLVLEDIWYKRDTFYL